MKKEQINRVDVTQHFHIMERYAKAVRRYEDLVAQANRAKIDVDKLALDANDSQRVIARRYKLNNGDKFMPDGTIVRKQPTER